jgi:predicted ATPase/class 3 adenylate cyclase
MLPTGTVTFLFTDVEGNVPIWERDPVAMKAALARHHAILYAATQEHQGVVFKILGDEFQIAFEFPENAIEAALQAQHGLQAEPWGETGPLTVRMGLHTGPVEIIEGVLDTHDYAVSHTINRVARIRSSAHGGQILLSSATAELLHGYRPNIIHLRDLGEVYLKGMSIPEHTYQVVVPDLPDTFPPLLSIAHPNHNLPLQLTSFIGREKEIAVVKELLVGHRLVTLTGPGGTGKTRLALQTAIGLVGKFPDGIWLVELASIADPGLVSAIAGRTLGLRELPSAKMMELLQEYLEQKHLLLILDNCEHVIEACMRLADALLSACPKLTLLASSREALGIPGEIPFRVPPMHLPSYRETYVSPSFEALAQSEAIRLFVDRAVAIQPTAPGFALTPENAPVIFQICQRLDGIPLAIELAAARTRLMQVEDIAQRLDDRFSLLTGGSRAAPGRYQTLRASIDWSYELLSPLERTMLQRLSVFAGGWALDAAEVVGGGEEIQSCDMLEILAQLVDKSLVDPIAGPKRETRYRMLETIRQYAQEKLVEAGQAEAVRQRHLMYYLDLAEKMEPVIRGPGQRQIQERLEAELDNLRLALAWSLEGRGKPGWDPEPGLRLATALHWYWHHCSRHDEANRWLELLLSGESEARGSEPLSLERTRYRAWALYVNSWMAQSVGDFITAGKLSAESRQLYQSLGAEGKVGYAYACWAYYDPQSPITEGIRIREQALEILFEAGHLFAASEILMNLFYIAFMRRDFEGMKALVEKNLALKKEIGDLDGYAAALNIAGILATIQGKLEQARSLFKESLGIFSAINSVNGLVMEYLFFGNAEAMFGNYAQAADHFNKALSIARRHGHTVYIHAGTLNLGKLSILQGDIAQAAERLEEDLAYVRKKGHRAYIATIHYYLGLLAWVAGDLKQATRRYTDALNFFRGSNANWEAVALVGMGKVALARGEIHQAQAFLRQALGIPIAFMDIILIFDARMITLEAMSLLAAARGKLEGDQQFLAAAVRLLGATEDWHTSFYYLRLPGERQEREECLTALREFLDEHAFADAWAEGQATTEAQAVAYALKALG